MKNKIPKETISRLFTYFRSLLCLSKIGKKYVSSYNLSKLCNVNPAIIRKDFSYFGDFGTKGVGYDVENLIDEVKDILQLEPPSEVALAGVGNIGKALLSYRGFDSEGFKIVMAFDNDLQKIGKKIHSVTIENIDLMKKRIIEEDIKMGVLTVPEEAAHNVAQQMKDAGIKAILSFAPCQIVMPENIEVTCIDLSTELSKLAYYSYKK
ncbi:MAG TPA: redox-sensing transcriptional repressor Rex [bacterium]|nr:redox-sensing transcriptional repressor Rex [bacterium]